MAGYPPPYPPPYGGPQGPGDWKQQQRAMREQARMQREAYRAQAAAYRAQHHRLRRGSIVGPLLLITLGVVFLMVQIGRLPSRLVWGWYGQWWPVLLIGVGLLVLLEWGVDMLLHRDSTVPYVRRSMGGGVVFLLIFLVVAGIVFSAARRAGTNFLANNFNLNQEDVDEFLGDKHESDQTILQAFSAGDSFEVDNPRGDVTVSGTSDDNQVHILLHKEVYSRSDSDAADKAQRLSATPMVTGNNIQLRLPAIEGARVDLIVTIPPAAAETVIANHGDVHVSDIKGPINITANHGDVEVSAITGAVITHINNSNSSFSAHSTAGSVSVTGRGGDLTLSDINGPVDLQGDFFGATHLEHIRNTIKFHTSRTDFQLARLDGEIDISTDEALSADQAVGPVILTTRDRNITLERISGDVAVTNRNGKVSVTSAPPLGNLTVENRNGSVNLTLPDQAAFNVHAQTTDGNIANDFSLPQSDNDHVNVMTGTVGKGTANIKITTSQGDIALKRASIAPLPPAPPPQPAISIASPDGSSVYVGKDGVRISNGHGGDSVVVDKSGLRITSNADGSSSYTAPDGTRLITNADRSYTYTGSDGSSLVSNADGSKVYSGRDGTHIELNADGSKQAIGASGTPLSDSQIRERIGQAERQVRRIAEKRDAERRHRLDNDH
jgi:DUF4097 and DUF4098 domain-containing protein YvlB